MNEPVPAGLDPGSLLALTVLGAMLVVTAYTELQDSRIPNWVTIPGLLAGLLIGYLPGGVSLGSSVGGFLTGFGFLFVFYMFGGMGGGDVKLMGAVGSLMGYPLVIKALMYTALIGGMMAVVVMVWRHVPAARIAAWMSPSGAEPEPAAGVQAEGEDAPPPDPSTVPYGFAIIGGCLVTFLVGAR